MPATLIIKAKPKSWAVEVPDGGGITVGRLSACDVQLLHAGVSGKHLEIRHIPGGWIAKDLKSRNGTFVNGKKISATTLEDGDVIKVGACEIVFSIERGAGMPQEVRSSSSVPDLREDDETVLAPEDEDEIVLPGMDDLEEDEPILEVDKGPDTRMVEAETVQAMAPVTEDDEPPTDHGEPPTIPEEELEEDAEDDEPKTDVLDGGGASANAAAQKNKHTGPDDDGVIDLSLDDLDEDDSPGL